ncbi:MAG: hypothetical protein HFG67_02380 [Firmicutes bacterium]|nr:hypothetical protein [Bacillota bacterium]
MELDILRITAVAITGVIVSGLIKSVKPEFTVYIVITTVIIIFFLAVGKLRIVFEFLSGIYSQVTYGKTFFPILIKVLAVAYLTDFTSQLCKDAGESAIGSKLELAGKIIIFYLSIPILVAIIELINSVL